MRWLVACEYSGRMREALRAEGHEAWSCDLLDSEDNSPFHIKGDVLDYLKDHARYFDGMIAHPPCTYLANSGVRWLSTKFSKDKPAMGPEWFKEQARTAQRWRDMREGAAFFAALLDQPIKKIAVENPIMHRYGKAAIEARVGRVVDMHFVQPWWFGDPFFKATGFTLKGLPPLVEDKTLSLRDVRPKPGTPEHKAWSAIHRASPGADRWKDRSRTFPGIAVAAAKQWGNAKK